MDELEGTILESILKQWNTDNPDGAAKQAFNAASSAAWQKMSAKQHEMAEAA